MLTANVTTSHRKRQRRHARIPVAVSRDRRSVRLVVLPTPGMINAIAAPDAPWPGHDDRHADLDHATWEDAEWR
jgi:hypothetical protein